MRIWHLIGVAGKVRYYKHEPLPDIIVKPGVRPSLEVGEEIAVVPLAEHSAAIERIQERCPHKNEDGSSAVESSSTGMYVDCTICGKDWDYD